MRKNFLWWFGGGVPARSPIDLFGASNVIWWAAEDQAGLDGANISTVVSRGSGSFNLTPQASFEPTLHIDGNGKKWFRFNEKRANAVLTNFSTSTTDYILLVCSKYKGAVPATEIGNVWNNSSGNRIIYQSPPSLGNIPYHYITLPNTLYTPAGPVPEMVQVVQFDFTNPSRVYVNDTLDPLTSPAYTQMTYGPTTLPIGSTAVSGVDALKADITDIVLVKGVYSDAFKAEMRDYFQARVSGYPNFAFHRNSYTAVNVTDTVIEDFTGATLDYAAFGSFCIRRSNGKYYRVSHLGSTHNAANDALVALQTSTDKGTTWSSLIPLVTGLGVVTNPYSPRTSSTSVAIGTGSKVFTIATGQTIPNGTYFLIADQANIGNYFQGSSTDYNSGTGALTVNVTFTSGSGTLAAWNVYQLQLDDATITRTTPAGIFVNSNGRVFVGYNRNRGIAGTGDWDTRLVYSDDDLVTLTKITGDGEAGLFTADYPTPGQCTTPNKILEYNGSLYTAFYARTGATGDREIVVYKSDDGLSGQTWTKLSTPQAAISHDYEEPLLVHLGQGVFRIIMRSDTQATSRSLYSWDAGVTWSTTREDQFNSVGFSGGVVTPSGSLITFGRYSAALNQNDTMLNISNRYGQQGTYTVKKANADNYYNVYGALDWDYDLNIPVGVYWEELSATQGSGPTRIVFVKLVEA